MIHLYHGDGKGKTTCAMGLAVRALGNDMNVIIVHFLKGSMSSEIKALKSFDLVRIFTLKHTPRFTFEMTKDEKEEVTLEHNRMFQKSTHFAQIGYCDMLVLDELCAAWSENLINKDEVLTFLKKKGREIEIVITGRNPPKEFTEIADYNSEVVCKKHPYEKGVSARKGIEY